MTAPPATQATSRHAKSEAIFNTALVEHNKKMLKDVEETVSSHCHAKGCQQLTDLCIFCWLCRRRTTSLNLRASVRVRLPT